MEFDDISDRREWAQLFDKQRDALRAASQRKGEQPRDRKPRDQLISEFMGRGMANEFAMAQSTHLTQQSWVAPPYPPSTAASHYLQKLFIKDLRLETHHRGSYVLLRAVTPSTFMTAVMAIMEDEKGHGVPFQLFQQKANAYRTAKDVIQEGHICILKEPYFKVMNDGGYGLRVDHVGDILWLSVDDERVPPAWKPRISDLDIDAMELKDGGNRALEAGKPYEAGEFYTEALKHTDKADQRRIIQLNRSLVNLKLEYYDQALQDAGIIAAPFKNSEKSLFRAARALYGLERYQESHDMLITLLSRFPNCVDARTELVRTGQRLKEKDHGDYNFKSMYEAANKTPPYIDCATYLGSVAVKPAEGQGCGRGLFTTKDATAGDLLLCEKAFSYCWANEGANEVGSKTSLLMNTNTKKSVIGTQADLITEIVQKLHRNPSLLPALNALHHGDYQAVDTTEVDGSAVVDTFLVDRIISLNAFGCPRTSLESHFKHSKTSEEQRKEPVFHTTGLFPNASYINHSCNSNARRTFIGDMQIVRAARNIPANTEITFWYHAPDPMLSYQQTQDRFGNWGFVCTCCICENTRTTPKKVLTKRKALLGDLEDAFSARPAANLAKAERLLAAIEKTYDVPASTVPRLTLWDPYLLLTRFYSAQKNPLKAIETAYKVLEAQGYVIKRQDPTSATSTFEVQTWGLMQTRVVETWMHIWMAGYAAGAPVMGKQAKAYTKMAYKIVVGEDKTFGERYGKLGHGAMFEGVDLVEAFQSMDF